MLCIGPLSRSHSAARGRWRSRRQVAFSSGVALLLVALASPLDTMADEYLFSAHMVQHLLLTLVAAPLLLAGTPGWLLRDVLDERRT